jgi:hypothetical protein
MHGATILIQAALRAWMGADIRIDTIRTMPKTARDHSSGIVRFYEVTYHHATVVATVPIILKETLVYERQILALLTAQGHPTIPLSYALDWETREPQLLCQYDAGLRIPLTDGHLAAVAHGLATIHHTNRGAPYLPWMRRLTSATFFGWWQPIWQEARRHPDFIDAFGSYIRPIERSAQRIATCIDGFWKQGASLTVLHTDLSPWHVLIREHTPFIIDWDQARYGPLYFDLVNLFTPRTVPLYYQAAREQGFELPYRQFMTHFQSVWAFPGLKYMIPPLTAWLRRKQEHEYHELHAMLVRASAQAAPAE